MDIRDIESTIEGMEQGAEQAAQEKAELQTREATVLKAIEQLQEDVKMQAALEKNKEGIQQEKQAIDEKLEGYKTQISDLESDIQSLIDEKASSTAILAQLSEMGEDITSSLQILEERQRLIELCQEKLQEIIEKLGLGSSAFSETSAGPSVALGNASDSSSSLGVEAGNENPPQSPQEALSNYMNSHNYGWDDFPDYSKDPEWRALQRAANPDYKLPPIPQEEARAKLAEYMNAHNYGKDDYPVYSRDPVWQDLRLNAYPSSQYSDVKKALDNKNVGYRAINSFTTPKTSQEIIARVSGGDRTRGSCSSAAFAYAGNRGGYDVLDFRSGESMDYFSSNNGILQVAAIPGLKSEIVTGKDDFECTHRLMDKMEPGREYYLATGEHAAIVKNMGSYYEYLELQSGIPGDNGWFRLDDHSLVQRFGCDVRDFELPNILIDVESMSTNIEFIGILGYINTAEDKQWKGASGHVR